ncbi:MAG: 50S ribosomal protein L29 [Nitrospinae bacterium]|nr:50S ribosomal protein L29 [Nitrospinota bacterium]
MKAEEVRNLSEKEREEKARDLQEELFNLKIQLATGKIENPGRLRYLRRDIAKIKTIQKETARAGKAVPAGAQAKS